MVIKMKCSNCETENPENAVYCQECGLLLHQEGKKFWNTSLGKSIYKIAPGFSTSWIMTADTKKEENLVQSSKTLEIKWTVVAVSTIIFLCGFLLFPTSTYIWIILGSAIGIIAGLNFKGKPTNFLVNIILAFLLSIIILTLFGF